MMAVNVSYFLQILQLVHITIMYISRREYLAHCANAAESAAICAVAAGTAAKEGAAALTAGGAFWYTRAFYNIIKALGKGIASL